jgi:hypothetical protein
LHFKSYIFDKIHHFISNICQSIWQQGAISVLYSLYPLTTITSSNLMRLIILPMENPIYFHFNKDSGRVKYSDNCEYKAKKSTTPSHLLFIEKLNQFVFFQNQHNIIWSPITIENHSCYQNWTNRGTWCFSNYFISQGICSVLPTFFFEDQRKFVLILLPPNTEKFQSYSIFPGSVLLWQKPGHFLRWRNTFCKESENEFLLK